MNTKFTKKPYSQPELEFWDLTVTDVIQGDPVIPEVISDPYGDNDQEEIWD